MPDSPALLKRGRDCAKISVVTVVELGLHNPIAAAVGSTNESEAVLVEQAWDKLPEKSLWLVARYHGVAKRLVHFRPALAHGQMMNASESCSSTRSRPEWHS